jgi:hypothetical protein|tara:strand:- start:48 stop:266 length:219 start_codon:yes stop_codon:yes gene_type:complete
MNSINLHNVQSIEVTETKIREAHNSDEKYYAAREIVITDVDGNRMSIALYTDDSTSATEVLEALQPKFKFNS